MGTACKIGRYWSKFALNRMHENAIGQIIGPAIAEHNTAYFFVTRCIQNHTKLKSRIMYCDNGMILQFLKTKNDTHLVYSKQALNLK